jgi:segregation and condensation protein B
LQNEIENIEINEIELEINLNENILSKPNNFRKEAEVIKPLFLRLSKKEQKSALEALIFSAEEPISSEYLYKILLIGNSNFLKSDELEVSESLDYIYKKDEIASHFGFSESDLVDLINDINLDLDSTGRAFQIVNVAGGYQFATREHFGELIQQLIKTKNKKRLSNASLECLAIIAYKQPISKPEIESIRGVNSNEVVNSLIEKKFIEPVGRRDVLGKPLLYGTTIDFLKTFALNSIEDLPRLKEFEELNNFGAIESESQEFLLELRENENGL